MVYPAKPVSGAWLPLGLVILAFLVAPVRAQEPPPAESTDDAGNTAEVAVAIKGADGAELSEEDRKKLEEAAQQMGESMRSLVSQAEALRNDVAKFKL